KLGFHEDPAGHLFWGAFGKLGRLSPRAQDGLAMREQIVRRRLEAERAQALEREQAFVGRLGFKPRTVEGHHVRADEVWHRQTLLSLRGKLPQNHRARRELLKHRGLLTAKAPRAVSPGGDLRSIDAQARRLLAQLMSPPRELAARWARSNLG